MTPEVRQFLVESNAIEGVYGKEALEDAFKAWEYLMKQTDLTLAVVLTTHKLLMRRQPMEKHERGHFRQCPVFVGGVEAMRFTGVPYAIEVWCNEMNFRVEHKDWKGLHVEYERIHPFVDGNGRTGRMFMNWNRIKVWGEPLLVIKAAERQKYYQWFRK